MYDFSVAESCDATVDADNLTLSWLVVQQPRDANGQVRLTLKELAEL